MDDAQINDCTIGIGLARVFGIAWPGVPAIKAKVETGTRTSALHAFEVRLFTEAGIQRVEFKMHPRQRNSEKEVACIASEMDEKVVSDSDGHKETR